MRRLIFRASSLGWPLICAAFTSCMAFAPCAAFAFSVASLPTSGDTLYLESVLARVAEVSHVLRAEDAAVAIAGAEVLRAKHAFDVSIELRAESAMRATSVTHASRESAMVGGNAERYRLSLMTRTPLGIAIEPFVAASSSGGFANLEPASSAGVSVHVPVFRLGSRAPDRARLDAARQEFTAARHLRIHALAGELRAAATAYWEYSAARKRHEVLVDAEGRAREVLRVVRRLVAANERAAADEEQVAAFLADRVTRRAAGAQAVQEAAARLAVVMDLPVDRIDGAVPDIAMPDAMPDPSRDVISDGAREQALARRKDLEARIAALTGERTLARAAKVDMLPRLELGGELSGGKLLDEALNGSRTILFSLTLSASMANRAARAAWRRRLAREQQRRAMYERARQEASAALHVAHAAVRNASEELVNARTARRAHEQAVSSERKKLSAGFATIFDLILAEDRLMNATISETAAELGLANALVRYAYEAGLLNLNTGDAPHSWMRRLLHPYEFSGR